MAHIQHLREVWDGSRLKLPPTPNPEGATGAVLVSSQKRSRASTLAGVPLQSFGV